MRHLLLILALTAPLQAQVLKQNGRPSALVGITDGTSAATGFVGEFISTNPVSAGSVNFPASTALTAIATMTLTAGDWEISGQVGITMGGTTAATDLAAAISNTSPTVDSRLANNVTNKAGVPSVSVAEVLKVGPRRVNITATTIYYLLGGGTYSVLGGAVFNTDSILQARRIR